MSLVELADFRWLRPLWLTLLPLALGLYVVLGRRHSAERTWAGIIAPHLLAHLRIGTARGWRPEPRATLCLGLALAALALAGPSWRREAPPFVEERAPLVVALDLSPSMNAADLPPTRLVRARHKLRDLLSLRQGARTALIVYAGSAHVVVPPTDDAAVLLGYVDKLSPALMPRPGKRTEAALALANEVLAREAVAGSVVLITDGLEVDMKVGGGAGVSRSTAPCLPNGSASGRHCTGEAGNTAFNDNLIVWSLIPEAAESLRAAGLAARAVALTLDASDAAEVQRRVDSHLAETEAARNPPRWRDEGEWLLWPLVLLAALSFRRGWTVRW